MSSGDAAVGRLVGLAMRAGQLALGVPQVEQALRRGKARVVFLASDGSYGQKKGVFGLARGSSVPVYEGYPGELLAAWTGSDRITALAVTDAGFAGGIVAALAKAGRQQDGAQDREGPAPA
jgi:ribosomal protein L7Ae-like RNA K-turn-binding protein